MGSGEDTVFNAGKIALKGRSPAVFRWSIALSNKSPGIICRKASWFSEPYHIDAKPHNSHLYNPHPAFKSRKLKATSYYTPLTFQDNDTLLPFLLLGYFSLPAALLKDKNIELALLPCAAPHAQRLLRCYLHSIFSIVNAVFTKLFTSSSLSEWFVHPSRAEPLF